MGYCRLVRKKKIILIFIGANSCVVDNSAFWREENRVQLRNQSIYIGCLIGAN